MLHRYPSADSDPNIIAAAVAEQIAHCIRTHLHDPTEATVSPSAAAWRWCFTKPKFVTLAIGRLWVAPRRPKFPNVQLWPPAVLLRRFPDLDRPNAWDA